jgi:Cof subfamily protein (haloacid dehalogenase superfamily)
MSLHLPIRLVLTDVDGTLVTQDKILTEAAKSAVRDLRQAGIAFAVASSRPPRGMRMLIEPLGLQLPLAGLNGGLYVNPDLSVIACHKLDPATANQAASLLLDRGLDVWVYTETDWLIRDPAGPHVAREAWILQFDAKVVASFTEAHLSQAVKIVGVSDDHDLVAACENQLGSALGAAASAARSEPHFLDVTNPQANKGAVAIMLSQQLNVTRKQVATIGDMPNDVLMFRQSGLSIAMGNASDSVKAQASRVTDSNADEGFAKAVRQFVLPLADQRPAAVLEAGR